MRRDDQELNSYWGTICTLLENFHRLEDHLKKAAEMARTFANEFGAGGWGYLAGLTHRNEIAAKGFKYVS